MNVLNRGLYLYEVLATTHLPMRQVDLSLTPQLNYICSVFISSMFVHKPNCSSLTNQMIARFDMQHVLFRINFLTQFVNLVS